MSALLSLRSLPQHVETRFARAVAACSREGKAPSLEWCESEARWCRERAQSYLRQNRDAGRSLGAFCHAWLPRDLFRSAALWTLCAAVLRRTGAAS